MTDLAEHAPPPLVIDPHGGLFGRRSVLGGLFVIAVLSFFGFGLQAIDDAVRNAGGFEVGERSQVTDLVTFVAAPGWSNDPDQSVPGLAVVATKNGWQIKLAGGLVLQEGQSLEDFAQIFYDTPLEEPGAEKSDLATFTTASGLTGVTWSVNGPTVSRKTWLVANGPDMTQMLASGPSSELADVEDELQAMAESIDITTGGEAP